MYKKILVPVDGSSTSKRGLGEAIRIAKHCNATLRLLHIVNELVMAPGYPSVTNYTNVIDALRESGEEVLRTSEDQVRREGVTCETRLVEVLGTAAANSIIDDARRWGAELIVMGTHGRRGIRRLALGSDAEMVLRYAPVPVLLVRDAPEKP